MKKKRIRVFCHGPIAFGTRYESPWEDLHYSWKVRPGRPRVMSGFCVESLDTALNEAAMQADFERDYPQHADGEAQRQAEQAEAARRDGIAVNDWSHDYPTVSVAEDSVTRAVAERAMTWALTTHHGLRGPFKFAWRRPEHVVIPVDIRRP
jgi:hypothetical protein